MEQSSNGSSLNLYVDFMLSSDYGNNWSDPKEFDNPHADTTIMFKPQMAISENGDLHLVWSLVPQPEFYGGAGVYYSRSTNDGLSWTEPVRIDGVNIDIADLGAWNASIISVGNELHVIWDSHPQAGRRYHVFSLNGGITWTEPNPIWGTFVSQTGPNPMIVDSLGNIYLVSSGALIGI